MNVYIKVQLTLLSHQPSFTDLFANHNFHIFRNHDF